MQSPIDALFHIEKNKKKYLNWGMGVIVSNIHLPKAREKYVERYVKYLLEKNNKKPFSYLYVKAHESFHRIGPKNPTNKKCTYFLYFSKIKSGSFKPKVRLFPLTHSLLFL